MGQTAAELRAEIEYTRGDMTRTVDAIEDRVSPKRIVERQQSKLRGKARSMREAVMGTVDDTKQAAHLAGDSMSERAGAMTDRASDMASTAVDQVRETPHMVAQQTKGSPLAAGLIAFGVGLLAAAVIPKSESEQQLASTVAEKAQPMIEQGKQAAQQVAANVKDTASEALEHTKDAATDAAQQVKDTASSQAQEVAGQAKDAAYEVRGEASTAVQQS